MRVAFFPPGDDLLSSWGHSAIWIEDTIQGTSTLFSYGTSHIREPGFLRRLTAGQVTSTVTAAEAESAIGNYVKSNRSVWLQELSLTPMQRRDLSDRLEVAAGSRDRIEHDFYTSNCTTGVRDILDAVLGGQIQAETKPLRTGNTFRSLSMPFATHPGLHLFLTLALARDVDHPLTVWDEMFLPSTLRRHLREVRVINVAGASVPLVSAEEAYYNAGERGVRADPWKSWLVYGGFGGAMGVLLFGLARRASLGWVPRVGLAVLGGVWLLVIGLGGFLLAWLWWLTGQDLAYDNANLLFVHPLSFALGWVMLNGALESIRGRRVIEISAYCLVGLGVLGFLWGLLPISHQANGLVVALTMPPYLGLALGLRAGSGVEEPGIEHAVQVAEGPDEGEEPSPAWHDRVEPA